MPRMSAEVGQVLGPLEDVLRAVGGETAPEGPGSGRREAGSGAREAGGGGTRDAGSVGGATRVRDAAPLPRTAPGPARAPSTSLARDVALESQPATRAAPDIAAITGRWDDLVTHVRASG